jgi:hypothetical protein
MRLRRSVVATAIAGCSIAGLVAAVPARAATPRPAPRHAPCTDQADRAVRFDLPVDGETATGFYSLPARRPVGIVVFSHGYGHSSYSWQDHLRRVSEQLDVITVAMDYRGLTFLPGELAPGIPETRGWPVRKGAEDGIAAAQWFAASCRTARTIVNFGVSMGGNTSGLIAATSAARPGRPGIPLFDYWIDVEGATNVSETYLEARALAGSGNAFAVQAQADIEQEMGGTIEQQPAQYREETVVTRAADIAAAGVKGVTLVHATNDGLVGTDESQEMRTALEAVGVPTQLYQVIGRGGCEDDTALTGYAGQRTGLAGHASETSTTQPVMRTAFDRLQAIFAHPSDPPTSTSTEVVGATDVTPLTC